MEKELNRNGHRVTVQMRHGIMTIGIRSMRGGMNLRRLLAGPAHITLVEIKERRE
jgi:hypothetical protein